MSTTADQESASTDNNGRSAAGDLTEMVIPASLKFLVSSIKTISNNQLTSTNYLVWSSQILKLFRANGFLGFLDGSAPSPDPSLGNDNLSRWQLIDQNLAAALCSTISPSILPHVLDLNTSHEIWGTLGRRFQSTNRSKIIQLRNQLHHIHMKDNSMQTYLSEVKQIVDHLSAAGAAIDKDDIILYTLNGLPPIYQAFKTAIRTRAEPLSLDELYALLCSEEINHQAEQLSLLQFQKPALISTTNRGGRYDQRGRGRSSHNKGRSLNQSHSNNGPTSRSKPTVFSPTTCQICGKYGHSAQACWHRTNLEYNSSISSNSNQHALLMQGDHSTASSRPSEDWILDSGASAHLTPHYHNLQQPSTYQGSAQISVGNGASLPITHSGQGILPTPSSKIKLNNLLHSPHLSHNLISISNLTKDNDCYIVFTSKAFHIKDSKTNKVILEGPTRHGLYPIRFVSALSAASPTGFTWHQRLGHPHSDVLRHIAHSNSHLHIFPSVFTCNNCQASKSHKLTFSRSASKSCTAFELVHSDVWGPSPAVSISGARYYVLFVDDYTKYSWLFPLTFKSDTCSTFVHFYNFVATQFGAHIKKLRTDNGGEYLSHTFQNFLSQKGILHKMTCPYTPEQKWRSGEEASTYRGDRSDTAALIP